MLGNDRDRDLTLLVDAAKAAGEIAMGFWRAGAEAWDKGGGAGPVSEADLAVNAMLERELRGARSDYGWLSEESADDAARLECERVFIVDPIDGTRAFLNDEGSFAHALAVVENGLPVAAVVHLPALALTYTAVRGGKALLNGEEIAPSTVADAVGARVLTTKQVEDPSHWRGDVPAMIRAFRPSLAWRLCLVAEGKFDATLSLRPAWEWDIAAASLIAECAGALATDQRGRALRFNHPAPQSHGLLVANPALHGDFMRHLREWPI